MQWSYNTRFNKRMAAAAPHSGRRGGSYCHVPAALSLRSTVSARHVAGEVQSGQCTPARYKHVCIGTAHPFLLFPWCDHGRRGSPSLPRDALQGTHPDPWAIPPVPAPCTIRSRLRTRASSPRPGERWTAPPVAPRWGPAPRRPPAVRQPRAAPKRSRQILQQASTGRCHRARCNGVPGISSRHICKDQATAQVYEGTGGRDQRITGCEAPYSVAVR